MRASVIPIRAATFLYPELHPEGPGHDSIYVFLIRCEGGTFLVDTGIGQGNDDIDFHYRPERIDLLAALHQRGVDPSALDGIINSHLHFDHCGNNRLFPGVPIYVQRVELEAARAENYTVPDWLDFEGANYVCLDGDAQLAPGIEVRLTRGHTPGHQSIVVRGAGSRDLVVAQAAQTARVFADFDSTSVLDNDEARSLAALHSMKADRAWFSHGEEYWTPSGVKPISSVAEM